MNIRAIFTIIFFAVFSGGVEVHAAEGVAKTFETELARVNSNPEFFKFTPENYFSILACDMDPAKAELMRRTRALAADGRAQCQRGPVHKVLRDSLPWLVRIEKNSADQAIAKPTQDKLLANVKARIDRKNALDRAFNRELVKCLKKEKTDSRYILPEDCEVSRSTIFVQLRLANSVMRDRMAMITLFEDRDYDFKNKKLKTPDTMFEDVFSSFMDDKKTEFQKLSDKELKRLDPIRGYVDAKNPDENLAHLKQMFWAQLEVMPVLGQLDSSDPTEAEMIRAYEDLVKAQDKRFEKKLVWDRKLGAMSAWTYPGAYLETLAAIPMPERKKYCLAADDLLNKAIDQRNLQRNLTFAIGAFMGWELLVLRTMGVASSTALFSLPAINPALNAKSIELGCQGGSSTAEMVEFGKSPMVLCKTNAQMKAVDEIESTALDMVLFPAVLFTAQKGYKLLPEKTKESIGTAVGTAVRKVPGFRKRPKDAGNPAAEELDK